MTDITLNTVQALVLADALPTIVFGELAQGTLNAAAAELRRQHALIAQMQRDAVQPGWKLVPVEPTEEMQAPSYMGPDGPNWPIRKEIYRAMLAAAPQPAPEPQQDQLQQPDGHSTRASGVCASTTPLPCPFCGGEARVLPRTCNKDTPYNAADRAFPVVRCVGCHAEASGKDWSEPATAITAWNRRSASGAQQQDDHAGSPAPSPRGIPVAEYLAKVKADPRRAAAMERVRQRFAAAESSKAALSDDEIDAANDLFNLAMYGDRGNDAGMREEIRAILARAGITRKPQWIPVSEKLPEFTQDCDWLFPRSEAKRERWILCCESQVTASVPGRATHWRPAEPLPPKAGITPQAGKESGE